MFQYTTNSLSNYNKKNETNWESFSLITHIIILTQEKFTVIIM